MDQLSQDSFETLSADDFSRQRNGARDSLMLTAQFRVAGSSQVEQVRVRNLSSGGLMAEYAALIERDTAVEVEVRGLGWLRGRIAWATDGRVGVAFEQQVDPMLARKPVGKGSTTPGYVRPVITRR